jgi:hypothetical protein
VPELRHPQRGGSAREPGARLRVGRCAEVDVVMTSVRAGNRSDAVDGRVSPSLEVALDTTRCRRPSFLSSLLCRVVRSRRRVWGGGRTLRMYASSAASSSFNRGSEVSVVSIVDLDPIVRARDGMRSTTSPKANVDSFGTGRYFRDFSQAAF